jgi:ATP-binding cassette subfamily B protein
MFHSIRQNETMDCGPTCLKMIMKFYGKTIGIQVLRDLCAIDSHGVSINGILEASKKMHFKSLAIKTVIHTTSDKSDTQITEIPLPAILHWSNNHFVVLYKIKNGQYFIADPAIGKIRLSADRFQHLFYTDESHGIAILLEPTTEFYTNKTYTLDQLGKISIQAFKDIFRNNRSRFLSLILFTSCMIGVQMLIPYITQRTFDNGILQKNTSILYLMLLAQVVIFVLSSILTLINSFIANVLSRQVNALLISQFIKKIFRLPLWIYNQRKTGDFINRINDYKSVEIFLTQSLITLVISLISALVYAVLLISYSMPIFLVVFGSMLLYGAWIKIFIHKRKDLNYYRFDIKNNTYKILTEMIEGVHEIKMGGYEQQKIEEWLRNQEQYYKNNLHQIKLNQMQSFGAGLLSKFSYSIITLLSGFMVINNMATIGEMTAILLIANQVNAPLMALIGSSSLIQEIKLAWERIIELQQLEDEPSGHYLASSSHAGSIQLKDVSFSYHGIEHNVIKNVNIHIERNKTTAIVGASGSGKTTILKLILGFHSLQSGRISVDNTDLKDYNLDSWRQACGVVMQEGYLFTDTIKNNITGYDPAPDDERYQQALSHADLQNFVESLPLKSETIIGKSGTGLSSGQKQRIMLARLFYKKPQYIFLDEATNSLDSLTEETIFQHMTHHTGNKTIVVIAHRLNSIIQADKIYVLKEGNVVEEGTHEELIGKGSYYYELFQNQVVADP